MYLSKTKLSVAVGFTLAASFSYSAYNTDGTAYSNAILATETYLDVGPASDALNMVDMFMCIMEATGIGSMPNQTYSALIDDAQCSGGAQDGQPNYITATLKTSRASNTAPYTIEAYFDVGTDFKVVADITVNSGPTTQNPNGSFTFNYKNAFAGATDKGYISVDSSGNVKVLNSRDGTTVSNWMLGTIDFAADSGTLTVGDSSVTHRYKFNSTKVHRRGSADADADVSCWDRTESNYTTRVHEHVLYDNAGALVSMTGPFGFTYTDNNGGTSNGYVGPWGVWLENNETGATRPLSITNDAGVPFAICYDDDDTGVSATCTGLNDNQYVGVTGYDFAEPIVFDALGNFNGINYGANELAYNGPGNFQMPWYCSVSPYTTWNESCAEDAENPQYRPKAPTLLGAPLTSGSGATAYHAVPRYQESTMGVTTGCDADVPLAVAAPAPQIGDFPAITNTWSDLPPVTPANTLKVIQGVVQ